MRRSTIYEAYKAREILDMMLALAEKKYRSQPTRHECARVVRLLSAEAMKS